MDPGDRYRACITDVHESQAIFRTLLDTFSRPGELGRLPTTVTTRITPALAPLMALLSHGTPFGIVGRDSSVLSHVLARATFGEVVELREAAYLAVLDGVLPDFGLIRRGRDDRPEEACQISVEVRGRLHRADGGPALFRISGPGVPDSRGIDVDGADDEREFLAAVVAARIGHSPVGFDLWLIDHDGNVVGIPRTSRVVISSTRTDQRTEGSAWVTPQHVVD